MSAIATYALHKRYAQTVALEHLDLQVPHGALFGLLGPNGAGKTTTFSILCGWRRATSGHATVLDTDCRRLHRLRGRVAALPQDASFPAQVSVLAQLIHYGRLMGMATQEARRAAEQALERVGLADARSLRGSELSHGMLKRVGLAQTLLGDPYVIFLDEPTSGLDPKSARHVKNLLASLVPATTVVLSSHNLVDVQEICTHGAILDHGRLVRAGTIHELTRLGAQIGVELGATNAIPWEVLRACFGADAVQPTATGLTISFAAERDVATVIRDALQILLQANTPILGVHRGTSLETAYLEATQSETAR